MSLRRRANRGAAAAKRGCRRYLPLLLAASFGASAANADFNVAAGYLSTSARTLATEYGWSLVWEAGEDRAIEHPFTIANDSLQGALEGLLGPYQGQFVADLYRANQVVVVRNAQPQVEVVLPGAATTAQTSQAAPAPVAAEAATPEGESAPPA